MATTLHSLVAFRLEHEPPLSQDDLADLLGVTRTTVARWETGAHKIAAAYLPLVVKRTGIPAVVLRPDLANLLILGADLA